MSNTPIIPAAAASSHDVNILIRASIPLLHHISSDYKRGTINDDDIQECIRSALREAWENALRQTAQKDVVLLSSAPPAAHTFLPPSQPRQQRTTHQPTSKKHSSLSCWPSGLRHVLPFLQPQPVLQRMDARKRKQPEGGGYSTDTLLKKRSKERNSELISLSEDSKSSQTQRARLTRRGGLLRHSSEHERSSKEADSAGQQGPARSTRSNHAESRSLKIDRSTVSAEAVTPSLLAEENYLTGQDHAAQDLPPPGSHSVLSHDILSVARAGASNQAAHQQTNRESFPEAKADPNSLYKPKRVLSDINYSFGSDLSAQHITEARDRFCHGLLGLQVTIQMSQKQVPKRFTNAEAIYLTNLMFIDLIGPPSRKRLVELLNDYATEAKDVFGSASVMRAEAAAKKSSTPTVFQEYFKSMSRATRLAAGHGHANMRGISHLNTISSLSECLNTHKHYTEIMRAARKKESWVTQFLTGCGYRTAQGKNWVSVAATYICDTLGVTSGTLEINNAQAATVNAMVENFGYGILTIFPMQALWKLRKMGSQRVSASLKLLKDIFPALKRLTDVLAEYVYAPIANGQPLPSMEDLPKGTVLAYPSTG